MEKKTIMIDEKLWEAARTASFISRKSVSQIIREALEEHLNKHYPIVRRFLSIEYVDEKEEKEILEELSSLTEEDLKIVKRERI